MAERAASPSRGASVSLNHLIKLRGQSRGLLSGTTKRVASAMAGHYLSAFRGRGMDFDEVRAYQAGDDVRAIDWRVTARTGRTHTKLYREERERPIFFLVDQGPEMRFATRGAFKSVIAAEVAALLAWSAVERGDRVGGLIFNGESHRELRPGGGQRGVLRLLKQLIDTSSAERAEPAALSQALRRLRHVARPGSMVIVLSDFRHLDADGERHLSYLAQHNDVVAIFIYDLLERELPPPGRYNVSDRGAILTIDTSAREGRQTYRRNFEARRQAFIDLCRKHGVKALELATHEAVADTLRRRLGGLR